MTRRPQRLRGVWWSAATAVLVVSVVLGVSAQRTPAGPDGDPAAVVTPGPVPALPGRVVDTVGVASYNVQWRTPRARLRADRDRLTARRGLDLIGWQETNSSQFRELDARYRARGWETWRWEGPREEGPAALALSWRTRTFELLDVDWVHVDGARRGLAEPHPPRWVVRARLRHRASGQTFTLLNTHLAHAIEQGEGWRPGPNARSARKHLRILARLWRSTPGDVLLSTGDYNFDHRDDSRARPAGGISDRFDGLATSSFAALGHEHVLPTHTSRWIDYVFVADRSLREGSAGAAQLVDHRVLEGFHSDHRPLVVRLRLYDR
ncbi:hypothetical protein IEQ44_04800 [Nocardioides sp. Y6]|uniref:Endonuclease/exonuclease/phosphatase family protein n=1 Tax=Nocardioides malaquae TaxID=2773426 RepID=A0ABR9RQX0_9ACTN|nr:endonuclease/exonuclease/phosphatase family protein [Nocardioides malaquae]MBE7323967.1 hypothetical protein [Nocardioides malaquae]